MNSERCVVVGGADIGDYARIRSYLRENDYVIYCDCGLRHSEGLGAQPSLIVGDFDSHDNPHLEIETIVLPVAKDDTDTVYAVREGLRRGFTDFLLLGVCGARMDHTLVNAYILFDLESRGCTALAVDDYSEFSVISGDPDMNTGMNTGSERNRAEITEDFKSVYTSADKTTALSELEKFYGKWNR